MKSNCRGLLRACAVLVLLLVPSFLFADAGVFTGNGQNLHQITSRTIQLVSIDVTIVLGRGPFLFDGTVPGMDRAEYVCEFGLRNLSDKDEKVQVGFPVDSEFARGTALDSADESKNWVLEYAFMARDEKATYHVNFVRRKAKSAGQFGSVFTWNMQFSPKETKRLVVEYRIPISMGLVPMEKDETAERRTDILGERFPSTGQVEMAGYITSTGSSWAGNVETAKFKLLTDRFEKNFQRRGIIEQSDMEMTAEELESFHSSFPVRHPWWIRQIEPTGWKQIDGGVEWDYKNYKPKDPIEVRYYTTPFPQVPEEVDFFVDQFLKSLGANQSAITELGRLRQLLLATYGKEPEDQTVKAFAAKELWYKPRKDFSMGQLTESQNAVLRKIDERIGAAGRQQP